MELNEIQAIDTMCRVFYCIPRDLDLAKYREWQAVVDGTFRTVSRKMGLKREDVGKIFASMGKGSVEAMLQEMGEVGVEYVFMDNTKIWSRHHHEVMGGDRGSELLYELVKRGNGRIIGGAGYNPFHIKEGVDEVEKSVKEYGFKYVWFHPTSFGLRPDDKKCYPLYIKCLELGIPVCFQTGQSAEPLPSEPGHPMYADEVAMDFPDLTIVLTHTGWPWVTEWMSMLWRHPNVYGNVGAYMPRFLDPALVRFMDREIQYKVMWASNGMGLKRCKQEFLELPISDETKQRVLRENAIEVFKLPTKE